MPRRPHRHRGRSTPRGPTSRSISLAWASSTTSSPISWPKGNLGSAAGGVAVPVMAPFTLYAPSSVVVLTCAPLGWPLLRPSRSSGSLSLGTRAVASPASVTCCPGTKPPTGSARVARGSPHGRGPAASSNSRRLSSSIGLPISCPPPRKHRHRYHGVFAPNHTLRRAVTAMAIGNVGKLGESSTGRHGGDRHGTGGCCAAHQKPRSHDTSRIAWAKLMARVGEELIAGQSPDRSGIAACAAKLRV